VELKTNPLVTIIIPCFNHGNYVLETIQSCIDQDYKNIEIIVVDNASTDNTAEVLRGLKVDFLHVITKASNKGLNDSIQIGLDMAKGKFIQILHSDDLIYPSKIPIQIEVLRKTDADCVYSTGVIIDSKSFVVEPINLDRFDTEIKKGTALNFIYTQDYGGPLMQSALFKKSVLTDLIELRKEFKSDDWAMLIKIMENYKLHFLNKPLFKYRIHQANSYKKYFITFPMRLDVISRLVPLEFQAKSYSNIFYSQALYLIQDGHWRLGIKFALSSCILSLNFKNIIYIGYNLFPGWIKLVLKKLLKKRILND